MGGFVCAEPGKLGEAFFAEQAEIDKGGKGTEALVGANVRDGLFASDVLLASLESQNETGSSLEIDGSTDNSARYFAHELPACGNESQIRATKSQGQAEALPLADYNVGAHLSGSFDQAHRNRIASDDKQGPRGVSVFGNIAEVVQTAKEIGVLHNYRGGPLVQLVFDALTVGKSSGRADFDQLPGQITDVGAEHVSI